MLYRRPLTRWSSPFWNRSSGSPLQTRLSKYVGWPRPCRSAHIGLVDSLNGLCERILPNVCTGWSFYSTFGPHFLQTQFQSNLLWIHNETWILSSPKYTLWKIQYRYYLTQNYRQISSKSVFLHLSLKYTGNNTGDEILIIMLSGS